MVEPKNRERPQLGVTFNGNLLHQSLRYDPKKKASEVLVDGASFSNGIALSHKEDFLLYSETGTGIVWKYHLKNSKNGRIGLREPFLRTPGFADNIRRTGKGGFLIAVPMVVDEDFNPAVDVIFKYPLVKRLLSRLIYSVELLTEFIGQFYPSPRLKAIAYWSRDAVQRSRERAFTLIGLIDFYKVVLSSLTG